MKKSTFLREFLEPALRSRNTGHYCYRESEHAELVLRAFEESGILDKLCKKTIARKDIELMPYEEVKTSFRWDDE